MSQENAEVIKAAWEAWNAGDMEAVRDRYDPAVIMRNLARWPEPGPWVGWDSVMGQFERLREPWDTDTFEPTSEFIEVGDRVVVRARWHATGRGPDTAMEFTHVYSLRNGKIREIEFFWEHAEALEAMGLSK